MCTTSEWRKGCAGRDSEVQLKLEEDRPDRTGQGMGPECAQAAQAQGDRMIEDQRPSEQTMIIDLKGMWPMLVWMSSPRRNG